ncbi:lipoate--protein ligase family protein [Spirochaeta lutea]|uniref:BPL/LPL catalytic domain-containing protein n=1 Tax=Spirochaeta lutea TaxID=1480694 RepID=A0A098R0F3_9SPIO|nr:biotin/lipoate A/B protein ligase family protein [Spirochaeta lutea]KGE73168.1 hypothetical protein DC28_05160 [Spirochaeta lutea]
MLRKYQVDPTEFLEPSLDDSGTGGISGGWINMGLGDIDWNLSIEEFIFTNLHTPGPLLLLYVSEPAVVMGKHQNPWQEADVLALNNLGIPLRRRKSGGGTVYHDEGNLNYSFIMPKSGFSQGSNLGLLASAVESLGISVEVSDRGDLLHGGKKFSGNALWYTRDRVLHHGTVLVQADLDNLRRALGGFRRSGEAQLTGRWVDSAPSPVVNLSQVKQELTVHQVAEAISQTWQEAVQAWGLGDVTAGVKRFGIDTGLWRKDNRISTLLDGYRSWEWNFGRTKPFECIFRNSPQTRLHIEDGCIRSLTQTEPQGEKVRVFSPGIRFQGEVKTDLSFLDPVGSR